MQNLLASIGASASAQTSVVLAQPSMTDGPILIVDDNPADVVLTRHAIKKLKLENPLHVLPGGKQLIAYLKGDGIYHDRKKFPYPVLLLLDLKMPHMDGFDVLAWLKDHPQHGAFPVVVLSGSEDLRQANRAYLLGARSFLAKPMDLADFKNTVEALSIPLEC